MKATFNESRRVLIVSDSDDNRYEIRDDRFGGLEIIANDGRCVIEPHVSNHITIKTQR